MNGTIPPGTAQVTAIGVANLPLGTHEVELTLARVDGASDASARVVGVVGTLGYEAGPGSSNHTIDDSHWASGQVNLSQGWNMMEKGHSNTLNEVSRVDVGIPGDMPKWRYCHCHCQADPSLSCSASRRAQAKTTTPPSRGRLRSAHRPRFISRAQRCGYSG